VLMRSVNEPAPGSTGGGTLARSLLAAATGRRFPGVMPAQPTFTTSVERQARLPVDVIGRGRPGVAVCIDERNGVDWIRLTPWFAHEPWRSMGRATGRSMGRNHDGERTRDLGKDPFSGPRC